MKKQNKTKQKNIWMKILENPETSNSSKYIFFKNPFGHKLDGRNRTVKGAKRIFIMWCSEKIGLVKRI